MYQASADRENVIRFLSSPSTRREVTLISVKISNKSLSYRAKTPISIEFSPDGTGFPVLTPGWHAGARRASLEPDQYPTSSQDTQREPREDGRRPVEAHVVLLVVVCLVLFSTIWQRHCRFSTWFFHSQQHHTETTKKTSTITQEHRKTDRFNQ